MLIIGAWPALICHAQTLREQRPSLLLRGVAAEMRHCICAVLRRVRIRRIIIGEVRARVPQEGNTLNASIINLLPSESRSSSSSRLTNTLHNNVDDQLLRLVLSSFQEQASSHHYTAHCGQPHQTSYSLQPYGTLSRSRHSRGKPLGADDTSPRLRTR